MKYYTSTCPDDGFFSKCVLATTQPEKRLGYSPKKPASSFVARAPLQRTPPGPQRRLLAGHSPSNVIQTLL